LDEDCGSVGGAKRGSEGRWCTRASDDIGACKQQNPKPTTRPHDYVRCFSRERERERRERNWREREKREKSKPLPVAKISYLPKKILLL